MRVLVDCSSEISVMTVLYEDDLNLKHTWSTNTVSEISGVSVTNNQMIENWCIQSRFVNDSGLAIKVWVLPSITDNLLRVTVTISIWKYFFNLALTDPEFHVSSPVNLLFWRLFDHHGRSKFIVDDSHPSAFNSIFVWILMSPVSQLDFSLRYSLPISLTVSRVKGMWNQRARIKDCFYTA